MSPTKPAKAAILSTGILLLSLLTVGCGGGNAQLPPASAGVAASAPVTRAAPLADFVVDVSQLHGGLGRLPIDERGEQVADWAVAGSLAQLVREQPEALPALGRLSPFGAIVVQISTSCPPRTSQQSEDSRRISCLRARARRNLDPPPSAYVAGRTRARERDRRA